MAESTFLSRSFGDQGVKLRIRKEPRVLGYATSNRCDPQSLNKGISKRSGPSDGFPSAAPSISSNTQMSTNTGISSSTQSDRGDFGSTSYRESYDDPPYKRQRMSVDLARRSGYEQDPQLSQRSYIQSRDPLGPLPARDPQTSNRGSYYSQGPSSGSGSTAADYAFGHQRTNSSSTSSPFVSPRNEYPSYNFSTPSNSLYQQPLRDQSYQYSQSQYPEFQPRQFPQLGQPVPPFRPMPSSLPSQTDQSRAFSRAYTTEGQMAAARGYGSNNPTSRYDYYSAQTPSALQDRPLQPLARTLPDPSQPLTSVLPPLQSMQASSQHRRDPVQSYSSGSGSNVEGNPPMQLPSQSGQENQTYLPHLYRGPQND